MKRIGLRTIKTAISIFLCLAVYIVLKAIELLPGVDDNFAFSWYNPFFAGIATAYSVHASKSASLAQAKNRCVASVIGGVVGILLITFYKLCGGTWPNLNSVNLETWNFVIPYLLISLFSILVVVIGVATHQSAAVFVAILTFLSVTINPNINVGQWQWQFGLNRILSTIVGVLIALGVNLFRLPHRHYNRDLLFCVGIDGILMKDADNFKGFMQYKLNYLNRIKTNVTLFTTRTPTTFMPLLNNVKISHPVICMSGAALYDTVNFKYLALENIEEKLASNVLKLLKAEKVHPFVNQVVDDVLFTFYNGPLNEAASKYVLDKKNQKFNSLIPGECLKGEILYFLIIDTKENINNLVEVINRSEYASKLAIFIYDDFEYEKEGFQYLKIYSKEIEKLAILHKYCEEVNLKIVGLSSSDLSNHLLKNSDIAITLKSNSLLSQSYCDKVLDSASPDALFREVNRLYYKNLAKYGKK